MLKKVARWGVPGVCAAVAVWVLATRWGSVLSAHPAYLVLLLAVGAAGLLGLIRPVRYRWLVLPLVLVVPLAWLRPFPADGAPLAAGVRVVDRWDSIELRPEQGTPTEGLVFFQGARVDARAYLPLLSRVAERGALVVVVKAPLDFAMLAPTGGLLDGHPEITRWTSAGHSLGGVAASGLAADDDRVRGLLLWASYPAQDLSGRDLDVTSVSGDRDGFTTPQDVLDKRPLLPAGTRYEVVPGAVHAFFGDYGPQPGDGEPATDRARAQDRIVEVSAEALGL